MAHLSSRGSPSKCLFRCLSVTPFVVSLKEQLKVLAATPHHQALLGELAGNVPRPPLNHRLLAALGRPDRGGAVASVKRKRDWQRRVLRDQRALLRALLRHQSNRGERQPRWQLLAAGLVGGGDNVRLDGTAQRYQIFAIGGNSHLALAKGALDQGLNQG